MIGYSVGRNHYHGLLHGIPRDTLMDLIVRGKSMSVYSDKPKFYSSSIVGGTIPLGRVQSLKIKGEKNKVWCFVGDMTFESGIFHECYKYRKEFLNYHYNLWLRTIIFQPTHQSMKLGVVRKVPSDIVYYKYKSDYPHHGTGNWVLF